VAGVKGQVQRRGKERRAAVVWAAREVFAANGYKAGSLTMVAELAGIRPAGILHHFGTKEQLLLAVLRDRDDRFDETLISLADLTSIEVIRAQVRFAEINEQERGLLALSIELQAEHLELEGEVHEWFHHRAHVVRSMLEGTIIAGQENHEIKASVDPAALAAEIVAFEEGAATLWLLDPELSLVELYRGYTERLIEAIQQPR
jgi:AcrR family transcriptional regulator